MQRTRRRKPRLFAFSREIELSHFEEWEASPADRALLEQLIDAFARICTFREVSGENMGPLAAAARHADPQLRGAAVTRLAVMCHYFPEAIDEMAALCTHDDEGVRLFAVSALGNTPTGVSTPLLTRLLDDDSAEVRIAAAQVGATVKLPPLIPLLSRMTATEEDRRVRHALQRALDFQRG